MSELIKRIESGRNIRGMEMLLPLDSSYHDCGECFALVRVRGLKSGGNDIKVEVAPVGGEGAMIISPTKMIDNNKESISALRSRRAAEDMERRIRRLNWAKERRVAIIAAFDALSTKHQKLIAEEMEAAGRGTLKFNQLSESSAMNYLKRICGLTYAVLDVND